MQEIVPTRIVIYAKDISNITGRKERTARKIIAQIRRRYNKKPGDLITIYEFCEHTNLNEERVRQFLTR
ncbi:hypothetical protein OCK74_09075 [Chitinophagaceae bacterium LB-8]|uniref:Uncharacterized protein n=1 Tax=Paraflavisolibacter caeni TaxID=2982496 RepID=A0A9X2XVE0_9BACT|nr:hypothetical protein [Paraflavisolibacter caeni]MCU7549267.1 hypothetical protein [Paraflavisolibacter caeni]